MAFLSSNNSNTIQICHLNIRVFVNNVQHIDTLTLRTHPTVNRFSHKRRTCLGLIENGHTNIIITTLLFL